MQRSPTPKSEKPAVTIANLERENDSLAKRIEELSKRSLDFQTQMNEWRVEAKKTSQELLLRQGDLDVGRYHLEAAQAKIAKLESVLCGYRQAIMDTSGHNINVVAV